MARVYVAECLPWLAPALYACRLVISEAVPLAAVDEGMRVYFNPRYVRALVRHAGSLRGALPELGWLWFHEIAHSLREHARRAQEGQARAVLWNRAADMEINDAELEGLTPPRLFPPVLPQHRGFAVGQLAEFYYGRMLAREQRRRGVPRHRPDAGACEKPPGDSPGEPSARNEEPPRLDEGGGVHGEKRPWELPEDHQDAPALSEVERELVRRTVAKEIDRCKTQGRVPGGWARWAEDVSTPTVDWRDVLRRRLRGAIVTGMGQRVDYSFRRPHRRASAYAPFLPPSLQGDVSPSVACVVDTSGSMSDVELARTLTEVGGVLKVLGTRILVIPCDAVPYEPIEVFTRSDILTRCRNLPGGGGTNMVAGIEAALKLHPRPDTVIVLTDGYTPFPERPYRIPVVFGILGSEGGEVAPRPPIPPWRSRDVVVIPRQAGGSVHRRSR